MDSSWVKIHSSSEIHKVQIIKNILEDNNIKSVILDKKDSSYLFGDIEIYVKNEDVIKAKYIISKNQL